MRESSGSILNIPRYGEVDCLVIIIPTELMSQNSSPVGSLVHLYFYAVIEVVNILLSFVLDVLDTKIIYYHCEYDLSGVVLEQSVNSGDPPVAIFCQMWF